VLGWLRCRLPAPAEALSRDCRYGGPVTEAIQPDEVIIPREQSALVDAIMDGALLLPRFGLLLGRLIADPRVPLSRKLYLGGTVAYLVSPVDLIPEIVPIAGWADDAILIAFALGQLLASIPDQVLDELWPGPAESLESVRKVLDFATDLIPTQVRNLLDKLAR
jgi:uncharacterized membrane protein YkvA (DUF1232 family)